VQIFPKTAIPALISNYEIKKERKNCFQAPVVRLFRWRALQILQLLEHVNCFDEAVEVG